MTRLELADDRSKVATSGVDPDRIFEGTETSNRVSNLSPTEEPLTERELEVLQFIAPG